MRLLFPVSILLGSILVVTSADNTHSRRAQFNSGDDTSPDPADETACALGDDNSCPKCEDGKKLLRVLVHTDAYPGDLSWSVEDLSSHQEILSVGSGGYTAGNTAHGHVMCVPEGRRYKFTIYDDFFSGGFQGLCSSSCCGEADECGYYKFIYDDEISSGSNFFIQEFKILGSPSYDDGELACVFGDEDYCPPCSENEKLMKVLVFTNQFPKETSWSVVDTCTNADIMSVAEGDYENKETDYGHVMCVPEGEYKFTIKDAYGDGLGFNFYYYSFTYGDQEASGGGNFGKQESKTLGSPGGVCAFPCISGDNEFCPSCSTDQKLMKVLVSTDSSPEETFWSVHDTCNNNQLIMEGGPYIGHDKFEPISEVMCVPASKYEFTIQHYTGEYGVNMPYNFIYGTEQAIGFVFVSETPETITSDTKTLGLCNKKKKPSKNKNLWG